MGPLDPTNGPSRGRHGYLLSRPQLHSAVPPEHYAWGTLLSETPSEKLSPTSSLTRLGYFHIHNPIDSRGQLTSWFRDAEPKRRGVSTTHPVATIVD